MYSGDLYLLVVVTHVLCFLVQEGMAETAQPQHSLTANGRSSSQGIMARFFCTQVWYLSSSNVTDGSGLFVRTHTHTYCVCCMFCELYLSDMTVKDIVCPGKN